VKYIKNPDQIEKLILAQRKSGVLCEKLLTKVYQLHLKPGDSFVDVGARVGHHLFPMARVVGASGKGLGIEANPTMAKGLVKKMNELNFKNLEIADVAAGREKGKASFFVMEEYTGWSSLYEQHVHPNEKNAPKKIKVKVETIDDILKKRKWTSCEFIKLDIENAEVPALMGAEKTIETLKPVIVFENSPVSAARMNNYSGVEFFTFFNKVGYDVFDIFMNKFTIDRWQNDKLLPSYYIALPKNSDLFKTGSAAGEYDKFLGDCL